MRSARLALPGWLAVVVVAVDVAPVAAGMPSITLTDAASMRLESISFFLLVFLAVAFIIRLLWNALRSDFPRLPRLSYPRALGLVGLWGLLFLLVLTMISGARELMTPGAWKKDGMTYVLADGKPATQALHIEPSGQARHEKLVVLFNTLAAYAAAHDGRYPPTDDPAIPTGMWTMPGVPDARYVYLPGRLARDAERVIAYEPVILAYENRFVLFANGDVKLMTPAEIATLLESGSK